MMTQQSCLTTSLKCLSTASQITAVGFRPWCVPTGDDARISALRFRDGLMITERHGNGKAGSAPGALAEMYWLKTQYLITEYSCLTLSKSGGNIYKIRFFKVLHPDWIGANFNASWRQFTNLIVPLPFWHISNPYFTGWEVVKRLRDLKTLDFSWQDTTFLWPSWVQQWNYIHRYSKNYSTWNRRSQNKYKYLKPNKI